MADSTVNTVCNCIVGTPDIDPVTGACRCLQVDTIDTTPIKGTVRTISTVKNVPQNIFSLTSITDWIKAHPFIIAGGLALLVYLFFFRSKSRSKRNA